MSLKDWTVMLRLHFYPNLLNAPDIGVTSLIDCINHVQFSHVHYYIYTEYVYVPGFAPNDEPSFTPNFSHVQFSVPYSKMMKKGA